MGMYGPVLFSDYIKNGECSYLISALHESASGYVYFAVLKRSFSFLIHLDINVLKLTVGG